MSTPLALTDVEMDAVQAALQRQFTVAAHSETSPESRQRPRRAAG
jgi:hypothetical protein